ncbi:MAG TPA: cache domain-containing protein, partial [Gammaproteobacteria bacterium]
QAALDRLFAQLVRTYGDYRSLAVLTRNGQRVSLAGEDSALTGDVSDQEWFTAALRTGEYISALYLDDDGNPRLAMATLTQAGEGQFVVRATLQLDTLYASLAELETGGDGGTYLVDPVTGLFLSRPYFGGQPLRDRNPAFDWGRKHFHVDYLEHGIEEVDAGSYTRADGAAVIEAHCCTREGDWLVVVERESAEVERQSQALLTELGLLAAATLAALALVTAAGLRLARRRAG